MDRVQPSRLTLALVSCCLVFIWFFTSHTQPLPVTHQPVTAASPAKLAGAYHEVLHDYQQYQGKLSVLHSQNAPHFVLFTAGLHPGTDIPWCPDCASARPVVRECVRQVAGALLEVEVGTREAWRDPNHPLKVGVPPISYLPTLVYWPRNGPSSRNLTRQLNSKVDRAGMEKVIMRFLESIIEDRHAIP
mmetsp:Transcript_8703/g.23393  ORF Transcript_8703/g.23393 Transcript_8703/m.23393 type:complete len:189 (+) Transcript_8703:109-675(+)